MNDSDIIKALECCCTTKGGGCKECPLNDYEDTDVCQLKVMTEAYKLIKRQQAEIKRSKSIEPTEEVRVKCEEVINKIRAEAIKKFAEKLKSKSKIVPPNIYVVPYRAVAVDDIDNLVKQMTGGEENAGMAENAGNDN